MALIDILLSVLGIFILIVGLFISLKSNQILKNNQFSTSKSTLVVYLILIFILGYSFFTLVVIQYLTINIPIELLAVLIFFFGSIFILITSNANLSILKVILGDLVSDEKANEKFRIFTGIEDGIPLDDTYLINCDVCLKIVNYTIADIVRANLSMLDRGISVESVFGEKSYILHPQHRCNDGRREFSIVHDSELKVRSIEKSRLLFNL